MKKLLLSILFFTFCFNSNAQIQIDATKNTVSYLCMPNTIDFVLTFPQGRVQPGLYLKIDLSNNLFQSLHTALNSNLVSVPNNIKYIGLDNLTLNSLNQLNFSVDIYINCNAKNSANTFITIVDPISLGILDVNTHVFTPVNFTLNTHNSFTSGGNWSSSVINANALALDVYYVNFLRDGTAPVQVDYVDSYNSVNYLSPLPIERTLKYINSGPQIQGTTMSFNFELNFTDEYLCTSNSVNISQVVVKHMRPGPIPALINTTTLSDVNSLSNIFASTIGIPISGFEHNDYLEVVETMLFPDYWKQCIQQCGTDNEFHSYLNYGCHSDLCSSVESKEVLKRGRKDASLTTWRLAPDPVPGTLIGNPASHDYWEVPTTNGSAVTWKFRVKNEGDDVAKKVQFKIKENYFSDFYFLKDITQVSVLSSSSPGIQYAISTSPQPLFRPSPAYCLNCSTQIVKEVTLDVGIPIVDGGITKYILPVGEYFDVEFVLTYYCPSGDNALFNKDKVLNDWDVSAGFLDECDDNHSFSQKGSFIAGSPNLYEMNPFVSGISPNDVKSKQLYLEQDFSPSAITIDAGAPGTWGVPTQFFAHNYDFCKVDALNFLVNDANLISSTSDLSTSMIFSGGVEFKVSTDELLDVSDIELHYGNNQIQLPSSITGNYSCGQSNNYTAIFLFNNQTVQDVYQILNNSDFYFKLRGSCIPPNCVISSASKNPNYTLRTYLISIDNCEIPLTEESASVSLNCPGCAIPGLTVENTSKVLERTNFGLEDFQNDGLADNSRQINPFYSEFNRVALNHSMVGDDLLVSANAFIDNGSDHHLADFAARDNPGTPPQGALYHGSINLNHLFYEITIENSNTLALNVIPKSISIEVIVGNIDETISIIPGTPNWASVMFDVRDNVSASGHLDLVLLDLSATVLNNLFSPQLNGNFLFPNSQFAGNEKFKVNVNFKQCNNFTPTIGSFTPSDNKFRSRVNLNMYLASQDFPHLPIPIFNAFESMSIAQNQYVNHDIHSVSDGMVYFCQTFSQYHYFYSIAFKSEASITDKSGLPDHLNKCNKEMVVSEKFAVGGDAANVFPFEFRPIPNITQFHLKFPGTINSYAFHPLNLSKSFSILRTYPDANCNSVNFHQANFSNPNSFPFPQAWTNGNPGTILTDLNAIPFITATYLLNLPPCAAPLSSTVAGLLYCDEYLEARLIYPFELNSCSSVVNTSVASDFVTTRLSSASNCNQLLDISSTAIGNNIISTNLNPNLTATILTPLISGGTHRVTIKLNIEDHIITDDFIKNGFIYFSDPVPSIFSNVLIDNFPMTYSNGKWFYPIGEIAPSANYGHDFIIEADLIGCQNSQRTIPVYFGWTCNPNTATIQDIINGNYCRLFSSSLDLNFPPDASTFGIDQVVPYDLCSVNHVTSTFQSISNEFYGLVFTMHVNDPTIQNISVNFIYLEQGATPCTLSVVPSFQAGTFTYILPTITSGCFPGYLKIGTSIQMVINYTPTTIYNGGSPFVTDYRYTSYCGNSSPAHSQQATINDYHVRINNCNTPSVAITPNTTVCSGSQVTFTANVSNSVGNLSYVWSVNGSPISPPQIYQTCTATVNSGDVFSVMVTDGNSHSASAVSGLICSALSSCCFPPAFDNNIDYNFSDLHSSQLGFTLCQTNAKVVINGTFTIDRDFSFAACTQIIMGPGAIIDVLPGRVLTIDDSHLYSCDNMWSGINLQSHASLSTRSTTIEDANTAVNMYLFSNYKGVGTAFLNNFIGINIVAPFLPTNGSGGNYYVGLDIDDVQFKTTRIGGLKGQYSGQAIKPQSAGYAGIVCRNITVLSIGVGIARKIQFENLNFGILSTESTLIVENSTFKNIIKFDPQYPRGFYAGAGVFIESRISPHDLHLTGNNNSYSPDFTDCENGIISKGSSLYISDNRMMHCDNGIRSIRADFATIEIKDNYINCTNTGISLIGSDNALSIKVSDNNIDAGLFQQKINGQNASATALDFEDNGLTLSSITKEVYGNQIYLREFGATGIHMNSLKGFHVFDNAMLIQNTVNMNMDGILVENCMDNEIYCNDIEGLRVDQSVYHDHESAIRISTSPQNTYSQNNLVWTSNGIIIQGLCNSPGNVTSQSIQKNQFGDHFYGLHYTTSARMEAQDHCGNKWLIPAVFPAINAINQNPDPQQILYSKYLVNDPLSFPASYDPNYWFVHDQGSDLTIDPSICNTPPLPGKQHNLAQLMKIIADTLIKSDFREALSKQAQVVVYQYLLENTDLLVNPSDLSDFYIASASTNIQSIAQINFDKDRLFDNQCTVINTIKQRSLTIYTKAMLLRNCNKILEDEFVTEKVKDSIAIVQTILMGDLDQLLLANDFEMAALKNSVETNIDLLSSLNITIDGNEVYDNNESMVNAIYFNTLAIGLEDSVENYSNDLFLLANQCPLIGGPAVYRARALMKVLNPGGAYDDILNCIQSGYVYRNGNSLSTRFQLYPNPSTGSFTLTYQLNGDATFTIIDMLGRKCKIEHLPSTSTSLTGSLSNLENGIYYYKVIQEDGDVEFTGKIVLEK